MKLTNLLKENKSVNEARVSAKKLLQSVVDGQTGSVEGIKLSKEMAQSFLDWQKLSPYGKKYGDLPFYMLFKAAFNWGLHRYADKKSKEYKDLEAKAKQMAKDKKNESVNEAASRTAMEIGGLTGMNKDAVQKFVDTHNLDIEKVFQFVKKGKPSDRMDFMTAVVGKPGNPIQKKMIKIFSESVNEGLTPFKTSVKDGNMKELITKYKEYQKSGDIHKRREVYKELIKLGNKFNFKRDDWKTTGRVSGAGEKAFAPKYINLYSESLNEAKYDIGMARKGNGITVYNRAEEENGDYKNVAHIDSKGKVKYYDKKIPSNIKKEIEQKAAEMMEMATESGMKLTDLLGEDTYVKNKETGDTYSVKNVNPEKHTPISDEDEEADEFGATADDGAYGGNAFDDDFEEDDMYDENVVRKGSSKLTDILKESNVQIGKVYSNPYAKSWVKEEEEQRPQAEEMTEEHRAAFFEAVKGYKTYGESVYRKEGLTKVYESIKGMVEMANKVTLAETGDWFDGVTVSRHMKRMNESFKVFEKTLREVSTLQQRLESSYDEIGEVLGKYYEINELEEGNEFGAARAKAIAAGDDSFEVDGKTYKVTNVDKDDKENAKKFANESMKLTSLLEGASTEEKRIVMLAVRKIAKYRNVDIKIAAGDVMRAAQELERDIEKGKVKK